ncbi:DUF2997 domain-containing protein [Paenibacillus glucanolyticus]|jgi:hypothetical protein|uniref:DUF2997 domain-containing protein n=1 Tax=Paenibacillus glucanolyticus TaxID=59843 RepID=A0A163GK81_9BACL|nr:DUF2997 domain-containing protein [Paenibacillus glucanolyticus]KZS45016.1 hypothetical protein AWU65_03275 [Paenibacillus glucanolyticus]OMF66747.1 hypothetical protein BK142_29440 [Paenibacillus glucanolyticus]
MADQRVEVICHADGTITIEAFDYGGDSCDQATKEIEQILGFEGLVKVRKPEFLHVDVQSQQLKTNVTGG